MKRGLPETAVPRRRPGGYTKDPHIPYFAMYSRGARLVTGRVNARAVMPAVLELVAAGRIDPAAVTERVLDFDDAREAFGEPTLKPVFVRDRPGA
jgi:alcohol dehydrogenase